MSDRKITIAVDGFSSCGKSTLAKQLAAKWETLKDKVDPEIFNNVSERFTRQLYNAREWCDQVNTYFHRISGIEDAKGREIY